MTRGTERRIFLVQGMGASMRALDIFPAYIGMTARAVYIPRCITRPFMGWTDVSMAFHAGNVFMGRILQFLNFNMERKYLAVANTVYRFFDVALQAVVVCQTCRHRIFAYLVRTVTVRAGGNRPWLLFPQLPLNNLGVHSLYV